MKNGQKNSDVFYRGPFPQYAMNGQSAWIVSIGSPLPAKASHNWPESFSKSHTIFLCAFNFNSHFQSYINDRNWNIFLSNLWESFCFDFIYNYNLFWSAAAPPLPPPGWCIRLAKSLCVRSLGSDLNWYDMFPFWSPCQASKFRLCARWSCSLERVLKFWNFEW